jgi:hypothetical protein
MVVSTIGLGLNALTLANSWVAFGGSAQTPYYTRTQGQPNWVEVFGYIKDGTATNGTYVATLPVGYRPVLDQVFAVASAATTTLVTIKADTGRIVISATGAASPISLNGIRFPVT